MSMKTLQITEIDRKDLITIIEEAVASQLQNLANNRTQAESSTENELLTREEAKNLLKTSYTSLWKYDREGLLPAKRIAGRVYYLKSDLYNLLNGAA